MSRLLIKIKGTVQGVGFRPYVWGLASSLGLRGFVANTSEGVTIEAEGERIGDFLKRLQRESPPLSRISSVELYPMPFIGYADFEIRESADSGSFTLVSPDVSVCGDCLRELFDEKDRRFLYPFINCTNCGPRYTITKRIPYDRPNTTMSVFRMCPECESEYHDPSDRRFHAQPNACPACGPEISLKFPESPDSKSETVSSYPVQAAAGFLQKGLIVAIKGIGGFHLACDATNEEAVGRLRAKKRKNNKPFALMAPDMEAVRRYCRVSGEEEELLLSNKRPVVLLKRNASCNLPDAIAPGNNKLGFMLPYAPLHHLLFHYLSGGCEGRPPCLVMTSGNLAEEPIQIDGEEAVKKLGGVADAFLDHNRGIYMRVDDSVLKAGGRGKFIRRSRGYAPEAVMLHDSGLDVLGVGADLKNAFTIMKDDIAVISQHIGDMENLETVGFFEETLNNLKSVYRAKPEALAYDLHPGYLSTKWALAQEGIEKHGIQHHHAHIASVMAENGIKHKVIGAAFDGTGYGPDGTLWGGEFLIASPLHFKRAGHLRYVPLPGGEAAIKEPWRAAVSYIEAASGEETMDILKRIGFIERYGTERLKQTIKILRIPEFSPLSSGAGRLIDAVSSMLGICGLNTFEGEAAMALESEASEGVTEDYPVDIIFREPMEADFSYSIISAIDDFLKGMQRGVIAAKFHNTVVSAIIRVVEKLSLLTGIEDVVLSGGVFQNDYLLSRTIGGLRDRGLNVYVNEAVPLNDGGISLGQAYILRERLRVGR